MGANGVGRDDHRYDAFVVRLWRVAGRGRLARAEVEHVATKTLARAADVPTDWVLKQIIAHLGEAPNDGADRAAGRSTTTPTAH